MEGHEELDPELAHTLDQVRASEGEPGDVNVPEDVRRTHEAGSPDERESEADDVREHRRQGGLVSDEDQSR